MADVRRIGILTGGGDVPGLNVAIKAATMRAREHGIEVVGLRRGWASVLEIDPDDPASIEKWTVPLDPDRVRTYDRFGGTALHTSRTNPSNVKRDKVPAVVRAEDRQERDDGSVDCTCLRSRFPRRWITTSTVPTTASASRPPSRAPWT
jgi:6-phosphofructokinase